MPNRLQWDVFCQCTNSGRHGRPSAWRERNEMGGHGNHSRSKPETRRLDRGEWQEFDGDLPIHGHGDHFFGVNAILKRFPNARFVATRIERCLVRQPIV